MFADVLRPIEPQIEHAIGVWYCMQYRRGLVLTLLLACASERPPAQPIGERHETGTRTQPADAIPLDAFVDAPGPLGFDAALAELRTRDAAPLADVIATRVAQTTPKMRLTREQGAVAANATLAILESPGVRELMAVMPRSTVELARAVAERGVPLDELERIAAYLVRVVNAIQPERLATFDDNHSHVTGRDWSQIDYRGESMTWQGQRDAWAPKGVESFKRAAFIHAYFVGAEKLAHWAKVYKPRGKMASVTPP